MPATTGQLGLVTPTQGDLSGTWGNTVNNGITEYTNIAIAGTLTLSGDGAVTLANTTGDASATNITASSTLAGAGTATAQFAIIKVTGALTTAKIITAPSYSKTYLVVNAATGSTVSFIRSGQTPAISIAVGESAFVYYNGTDYVKLATTTSGTGSVTSVAATVPSVFSIAGSPITTSGTLAMTYSGTALPTTSGGTGLTSFTSGGVVYASSTSALATGSLLSFDGTNLGVGTASPSGNLQVYSNTSASLIRVTSSTSGIAGIDLGDTSAVDQGRLRYDNSVDALTFGTSASEKMRLDSAGNLLVGGTAARGTTVGAAHLDLFNGTAPAGTLTNGVSLYSDSGDLKFMNAAGTAFDVGYRNIPQNAQNATSYTLTLADSGKHIYRSSGGAETWTIPAASSVAYPLGTAITFVNLSTTAVSIAITTDTMYLSSAGTTGTRTLAQYGSATAIKVSGVSSSGIWVISGSGLT